MITQGGVRQRVWKRSCGGCRRPVEDRYRGRRRNVKPVAVRSPVPTVEETRVRLGISKKRVAEIRKIMETPVPRRKKVA